MSSRTGWAKDIGPEQAIITAMTGNVTYVRPSESNEPQAVMLFLKLEEGDRLNLALNTSINVLFIVRGLGETWQGPKTLLFQDGQLLSQVRGTWEREHPYLLKTLLFEPQKALLDFVEKKPPSSESGDLSGVTTKIKKTYSILQKEFGENDATPDLYRLSVWAQNGQYDQMLPLLQDLLAVYRDNPVLLGWKEWVESRKNQ